MTSTTPCGKGSAWARELYDLFAPVRKDLEDMPADEIDAMIDQAVEEVRAITSQPYETWPADRRAMYETIGHRLSNKAKSTNVSE